MKVSTVLAVFIVLPMLASIGLYCYAFISTRWSRIDETLIHYYNSQDGQQRSQSKIATTNDIQLELQLIRHAFRSHYGLFGYCLDYKWIKLITFKPQTSNPYGPKPSSTVFCHQCNRSSPLICTDTGCCVS